MAEINVLFSFLTCLCVMHIQNVQSLYDNDNITRSILLRTYATTSEDDVPSKLNEDQIANRHELAERAGEKFLPHNIETVAGNNFTVKHKVATHSRAIDKKKKPQATIREMKVKKYNFPLKNKIQRNKHLKKAMKKFVTYYPEPDQTTFMTTTEENQVPTKRMKHYAKYMPIVGSIRTSFKTKKVVPVRTNLIPNSNLRMDRFVQYAEKDERGGWNYELTGNF